MRDRVAGPPSPPVVFWAAIWNAMNPTPSSTALPNSAGIPGSANGSVAPTPINDRPTTMGRRAPMRSTSRPTATDRNMGRNA